MKPLGSIFFFKSGTNSPLITFADDLESIQNPAQIDVNADGNIPNIFFSGSARVKYLDEFGQQYAERDPVGGERELGDFTLWDTQVLYGLNDIVEGSNGRFYISLTNSNQSNDPTLDATKWGEIRFIGVYNVNITYGIGNIVQTTNGNLWKSVVSSNLNNDPATDAGTNWLIAIDKDNVLIPTNTVIPQSGGGTLTALRNNELQDAGAYTIPLAATVSANQTITISQPDEFVSFEPVTTASGSDTITDSQGTDTSITFDNAQSIEIVLTSDGINDWRL